MTASLIASSTPSPAVAPRNGPPTAAQSRPRVLVTRLAAQAGDFCALLEEAGFEPVTMPTIAIEPVPDLSALDEALCPLASFAYLVLPSANAARIVARRLSSLGIAPEALSQVQVVAGSATAKAFGAELAAAGEGDAHARRADLVLSPFSSEAVVQALAERGVRDVHGVRVLLPRAQEGRETIAIGLRALGASVVEVPVYRTVPVAEAPAIASALSEGELDAIAFFSPSAVTGFGNALRVAGLVPGQLPSRPRVVCIGVTTADAARGEGLVVDAVARDTTAASVVEALSTLLPARVTHPGEEGEAAASAGAELGR